MSSSVNEHIFDEVSRAPTAEQISSSECPALPSEVINIIKIAGTVGKIALKVAEFTGRSIAAKIEQNYGVNLPNWRQWPDFVLLQLQILANNSQIGKVNMVSPEYVYIADDKVGELNSNCESNDEVYKSDAELSTNENYKSFDDVML